MGIKWKVLQRVKNLLLVVRCFLTRNWSQRTPILQDFLSRPIVNIFWLVRTPWLRNPKIVAEEGFVKITEQTLDICFGFSAVITHWCPRVRFFKARPPAFCPRSVLARPSPRRSTPLPSCSLSWRTEPRRRTFLPSSSPSPRTPTSGAAMPRPHLSAPPSGPSLLPPWFSPHALLPLCLMCSTPRNRCTHDYDFLPKT